MRSASPAALALALLLLAGPGLAVRWEDAAPDAGVLFQQAGEVHPPGDADWPAFPEVMGGGACWLDADGDGYDDLFLASQQYNPHNPAVGEWAQDTDPHSKLFIRSPDGDGTFTDATLAAGVGTRAFAYGCSAADYDGDGCVDLFVSVFGASELFRNRCDGTFDNVTATAAPGTLVGTPDVCDPDHHPCMATSSAWADYDRDGDLDLYVGTYVNTELTDQNRGPLAHVAQRNWLLRNHGGTFVDVAHAAGVAGNPTDAWGSKTLGVVWLDDDRDGWMDLYVANDETPNHLFRNLRDGTFEDVAERAGVADPRASMGLAARDYDNDGWPDLFMTHYQGEQNGFYRNNQDGTFEDRSGEDDLHHSATEVGWGTDFVDVDRDGWLDLVVANGHTEWLAANYDEPMLVFRSAPSDTPGAPAWDRNWTDITEESGSGMQALRVHRGAAFADMDLDGDTDVAVNVNANETAQLLRASGGEHAWLNVRLAQPGGNRFGVGARIVLDALGMAQAREVQAGSSYLSQNTLTQEFGLGGAAEAESLTVTWPDGNSTTVGPIAANQTIRIARDGTWTNDTVSPLTRAALQGTAGHRGWWRSPVVATLEAEDRGTPFRSGVALTEARIGSGAWQPYEGPLLFGEGKHTLRMRSRDAAGNQEPPRSQAVHVDTTPPAVGHALAGTRGQGVWWVSAVRATLHATDPLSGVERVSYRLDGGAWQDYHDQVNLTEDGVHALEYTARDVAGNEAPIASVTIPIDRAAPEARLVRPRPGGVYAGATETSLGAGPALLLAPLPGEDARFAVLADAEDATSGTAFVRFVLDGATTAEVARAPYEWTWDSSSAPPGPHALRADAFDRAGNRGSAEVPVVLAPGSAPLRSPDPWFEARLPWLR